MRDYHYLQLRPLRQPKVVTGFSLSLDDGSFATDELKLFTTLIRRSEALPGSPTPTA